MNIDDKCHIQCSEEDCCRLLGDSWWRLTIRGLFWPALRENFEVLQWHQHSLDVTKHRGQSQAEEHDEEENGPNWRQGHLCDSLREDNEG